MLITIIKYFKGYVRIKISGHSPERFVNLCSNRGILIWNLIKSDDDYILHMELSSFREIKPLLKKTNTKVEILDKVGLPFFLYKNRKRKVFVICAIAACICIYILSLFIWDVKVEGTSNYTDEEIMKFVQEKYVPLGKLKSNISCVNMETELRNEYDEIAWITCEINGTQLKIILKETLDRNSEKEDNTPKDLVAMKDGKIYSMITRSGTPVSAIGNEVQKGDILISGTIYIYNDSNEVLETNYVRADGDIYAETIYEYNDEIDINYYMKEYTDEKKDAIEVQLLNKMYSIYNPKIKYINYDIVNTRKNIRITDTFYLPFGINIYTYKEYNPVLNSYSEEEVMELANKHLDKYINELEKKGVEILENNVTIIIENNICIAKGSLKAKEPIGIEMEIRPIENNIDEGE